MGEFGHISEQQGWTLDVFISKLGVRFQLSTWEAEEDMSPIEGNPFLKKKLIY